MRAEAELYALVLSSRGIESVIVEDAGAFLLLIAPEDAEQAEEELAAHDLENQGLPAERRRVCPTPPNLEILLVYWAVLLLFFAADRRDSLSVQWLEIGAAQAGLIRAANCGAR